MAETDDDDPALDWGEDAATSIDPSPALTARVVREPETDTSPVPVSQLPGYEPGLVEGVRRGIEMAVEALRLDLIKNRNDPGVAAQVSQELGRAARRLRYPAPK